MGRLMRVAVAMTFAVLVSVTPAAPATALASPGTVRMDVNDFIVDSFDAVYELGRDEAGRSTLTTTERIVAVFPDFDQNRGLIRDLVRVYDGHETDIEVVSVTDERGVARPFETENYGDFLAVTIAVPLGQYVHGAQTYVISYTQRDVTRFFENTGVDEFYWDTNGNGWRQPFGRVSARIELAPELVPRLTGAMACYQGRFGSGDPCDIERNGATISAEAHDLRSGQNVTFAIAFEPGTFAARPGPFFERTGALLWGALASAIGGFGYLFGRLRANRRSLHSGNAIIAQYEPPAGVPLAVSAALLKRSAKAMTATILDLAVRGHILLLRNAEEDLYGAQAVPRDDVDDGGLDTYDRLVYKAIFGTYRANLPKSDRRVWFRSTGTQLGDGSVALRAAAERELTERKLVKKSGGILGKTALLLVLATALVLVHSIVTGNEVLMIIVLAVFTQVLVWGLIGLAFVVSGSRGYTPKAAAIHDHLMGLKEFIRVAEADRIRMLQSVYGAEVDDEFIVHIYERLLPYAVVFGYEREWQAELARYYRDTTPVWIAGTTSFNSDLSFSQFDRYVSTRPVTASSSSSDSGSSSSFSSSSGGSDSGGFSGGGGGGGGGRGI